MNNHEYINAPNEIKRLSGCFIAFRFNRWFITDNKTVFSVPGSGFCEQCFNRRYFSEYDGTKVESISGNALELARGIEDKPGENRLWGAYSVAGKKKIKSFEFASYDNCPLCKKTVLCSKEDARERYEYLLNNKSVMNMKGLRDLLLSFGFVRGITIRDRLGFGDEEFEKLLGGKFYSQVTARMLGFNGQPAEFTTLGYAGNRELAETKSMMEYVERYSLLEHTNMLRTVEYDENIINAYLSRFSMSVSREEMDRIRSEAIWAINLTLGDISPVPSRFIYDKADLEFIRPCSSGFAAHVDFSHSMTGSIIELVERDAFVRFWHDPVRAYTFSPEADIQKDIDGICSVLGSVLGNENLVSKCYVVQSPSMLPVVMATISSSDASKAPSLIFGYGAGFDIRQALSGSVNELRTNSINVIVSVINNRGYLTKEFNRTSVKSIPDRMNYYATSDPRSMLVFLDAENPLRDNIYEEIDKGDLNKMVERFESQNLEIYGIDVTPGCFSGKGAVVTRAFSPDLYPLQFEGERMLGTPLGNTSVKDELPHFFI